MSPDKFSINTKFVFSARLHFLKKAFVASTKAQISRGQPDHNAALIRLLNYPPCKIEILDIQRGEVTRLEKWRKPGTSLWGARTKLVLDQVHNNRIKTTTPPIIQVTFDVLFRRLNNQ